jgi:23S rRNA pseudouridine1911/1915/1917 synthase
MQSPEIIFEDRALVVISKPSGMVSNEAQSVLTETVQGWHKTRCELSDGESEFHQKAGLVHRLDRDTSGVMVLAKTEEAYEFLKNQFLERKTLKKYTALVYGEFKETEGMITEPLMRHPKNMYKFTVGGDRSKSAITEWKVIEAFKKDRKVFTLLELTPHTGRTHQLRVHLQHMNHPIVSDSIYGYAKKVKEDLTWCPRLFLHAKYLEFTHPDSLERTIFEAPFPSDLASVLQNLNN